MLNTENIEEAKRLSIAQRQAVTDAVYKQVVRAEIQARQEKSEKLRRARMAAGWIGIEKKR